ncbi:endolytic transglycosylase MltG [Roseovarius salis]|uniref:endolytic transglycosylase MltG n=1 Tax=Roseovarius salis TaxID=3376063 RepID=UPI0037C8192E
MWRHIASNFLTFLVVVAFLLAGVILWGQSRYTAQGPLEESICLRVERGSNMRAVSRDLEERNAVSNGALFRIGVRYAGKDDDLKAGSWLIPAGASMADVSELITQGGASTCGTEVVYRVGIGQLRTQVRELDPTTEDYVEVAEFDLLSDAAQPERFQQVVAQADTRHRIAIAEGVTSWQVVNALGAIEVLEGEVDGIPPEGSLAPFSYEVERGDDRVDLLERMREVQKTRLAAAWEARDEDLPLDSPTDVLILASIIEKETGVPEERETVASVFVNRLRRGMRLQTDPTVIYGITNGQGTLGRGLRQSELRRATPYNTYVIEGLPPTPIANPGEASLMAAVNPADTDYIFFVADGTGGHAFAETLQEHNRNVARWREIEAQRDDN